MADFVRAFTFSASASGSGDQDTLPETLSANQHVLVAVWDYSTTPGLGSVRYMLNGGAEVDLELVEPYTRSGNSDRAAFFLLRAAAAGSYVIRAKSLPYCGISAIIFNAKVNCWVYATSNALGAGEGTATGLNLTSPPLAPAFASAGLPALAFGLMTHNVDGSSNASDSDLSADTAGGWTLVHKQQDYDGASQPGASQYKQLTATTAVTSTFGIAVATVAYLSQLAMVVDFPEVYVLMGGTDVPAASPRRQGYFGRESTTGAVDTTTVPHPTFVPAGQGVVVPLVVYGHDPDVARLSDDGGNTWNFDIRQAYGGGTGNSANVFWSQVTTQFSVLTYDATSLPAGDNGRYGQIGMVVIEKPDTVFGFKTATGVARAQGTGTTVISPGGVTPFQPDTTSGVVVVVGTNQGHSNVFVPIIVDSTYPVELRHTQMTADEGVPDSNTTAATHNSDHSSGWWLAKVKTDGTPEAPTVEFQSGTGYAHTVITGFNILGGTPVVSDNHVPPQRRFVTVRRRA